MYKRQAHSYVIEAQSRVLLQLGNQRAKKVFTVISNEYPDFNGYIELSPDKCLLTEKPVRERRNRTALIPTKVSKLLDGASPDELLSQSAAGRALHRMNLAKSETAGRTQVINMIKQGLLQVNPDKSLAAGPNLAASVD